MHAQNKKKDKNTASKKTNESYKCTNVVTEELELETSDLDSSP